MSIYNAFIFIDDFSTIRKTCLNVEKMNPYYTSKQNVILHSKNKRAIQFVEILQNVIISAMKYLL